MIQRNNPKDEWMKYKAGDVFQILPSFPHAGWVGILVIADSAHAWGVKATLFVPRTPLEQVGTTVRVNWDDVDFIGFATVRPREI